MNKEEIEEIETLEIDFKDTDELELALEVSSKKAIYLINDLIKHLFELQQENQQLKDKWNKLKEYFNERIEVCDNRLSSPFCNFEKTTKERLIFSQCLEKLEELEQGSDNNE